MPVRQTSLWAYEEAKLTLGERQRTVLEVIRNFPGIDNMFIAEKLHLPINTITPRVKELREMGKVRECGKARNVRTGRQTLRWKVCE